MARQNSRHLPGFIEHRKIVLRRGEQRVDCFLQGRALWKRTKFAHHRARNRKATRNIAHLRERRFLGCADVNKQRDEEQKRIRKQTDESKHECATLADAGGDLGRARITQARREQCTQNAAAIHRKSRKQIKEKQNNIYCQEDIIQAAFCRRRINERAASKQKTERNDQVHRRTRRCDDQFLDRLFRHALQTRDPADRQQRNIRRVDAKGLRGKGMTEFVQNDAHKQEHDHQNS